jgi:putative transcriptional regulator
LLLAMPQMRDPNFARSVVLLCEHSPQGTMGLVINRPTSTKVSSVVDLDSPQEVDGDLVVWIGGPVETTRAWILTTADPGTPDRVTLADQLHLCASRDALRWCMQQAPADRDGMRFLLGYAGWAPGQLESELAQSAWLSAPLQLDLIFQTPAEDMWDAAIRSLGVDPAMLQLGPGVH